MSLASSPDCLFRPEDKALKMLFPSLEESNTFDDFFHEELYNQHDENSDNGFLNEGNGFINSQDPYSDSKSQSPTAIRDMTPPQPWRKGLWCLINTNGSSLKVEKSRKLEATPEGPSPAVHLRNHEDAKAQFAQAHQAFRYGQETKRYDTGPNAATPLQTSSKNRSEIHREVTLSPSPMYASLPDQTRQQVEEWQRNFQNFHLRGTNDQVPTSPQEVDHQPQYVNASVVLQNAAIGVAVSTEDEEARPAYQPAIDPGLLDPAFMRHGVEPMAYPEGGQPYAKQHVDGYPPLPVWTTESLHSSEGSHHSYQTNAQSTNSAISEHSVYTPPNQMHWSPPTTAGYSYSCHVALPGYNAALAAPKAQRVPYQILHHAAEQQPHGLGIAYPELEQMNQAVFHEPQVYRYHHHGSPGVSLPYSPTAIAVPHAISYPPLPPHPSHTFTNASPFTPRRQHQTPSRSPSPSLSPTAPLPRVLRQRSPTRSDHGNQHRRKSINKSGPIKDNSSIPPVPALDAHALTRPRSRSSSKPPRTPRTPRTPRSPSKSATATSKNFAAIDFVNFTPKDSIKLLSDVAPSGSSKTKARREAEAREKRKRLSEAALKAVRDAGGDEKKLRGII